MSHDLKGPTNRRHFDQVEEGGFAPLVRQCDDPHANFERIRNAKLWHEREQKRAQELERKQKV